MGYKGWEVNDLIRFTVTTGICLREGISKARKWASSSFIKSRVRCKNTSKVRYLTGLNNDSYGSCTPNIGPSLKNSFDLDSIKT